MHDGDNRLNGFHMIDNGPSAECGLLKDFVDQIQGLVNWSSSILENKDIPRWKHCFPHQDWVQNATTQLLLSIEPLSGSAWLHNDDDGDELMNTTKQNHTHFTYEQN